MKKASMMQGARVVVETMAGVKPGEKVLILVDSTTEDLAELLTSVVLLNKAEPFVLTMLPRGFHGEQLPTPVASAMKSVDVVIAPTRFNIAHTEARFEAQKAGARVVVLPEAKPDFFFTPGLFADFEGIKPKVDKLANLLSAAKTAHITSPLGTDITLSLEGRKGRALHGFANNQDISAGPGIEASIAPVEGSANGKIVVNESIPGVGLINEPVVVTVDRGYAVRIEGGKEAQNFAKLLRSKNDPLIYNVGELGFGMNPLCQFENSMLSDEGVYGTIHIALGTNAYIGGKTVAAGHYDMVFSGATAELDGETVLKDGNLVI